MYVGGRSFQVCTHFAISSDYVPIEYCAFHQIQLNNFLFYMYIEGSLGEVGELNGKIIGHQFYNLMYGDRFWYSRRSSHTDMSQASNLN